MKILFVTSEAVPFATSGGLGEVMSALPSAIAGADQNIECDVIMPLYSTVDDQYKRRMKKVTDIVFNLSWRKTGASVYTLNEKGITTLPKYRSHSCG